MSDVRFSEEQMSVPRVGGGDPLLEFKDRNIGLCSPRRRG